ncbi:MAG: GH92 family glycosyl hydrolase [Bacteroidales bacterium]|nr:GH92 family glycosyl hydrolase [Candidatus Hennigimonas equi]
MKKTILSAVLMTVLMQSAASALDYTRYADPFVGTGGHGHTFPAATAPFGMVQAGPDTRVRDWDGCSGYHYSDSVILGFTHTHLSGTGCLDYGDILFMPVTDSVVQSTFSHDRESASPGYYRVFLDHQKVDVRIAAGRRVAMHEYSYPDDAERAVYIDLHHRDRLLGCTLEMVGDGAVRGWRQSTSWASRQDVYFYAEFSEDVKKVERVDSAVLRLVFEEGKSPLKLRIALSSVSCENARENLRSELAQDDWDFERLLSSTVRAWNDWLGRIKVECPEDVKKTFYSALYHCAIHPSLYSDVNGEYRGMDRKVHKAEGYERYTVFSMWDVFRAEFPLFCMVGRDILPDFLESMLSIYRESGRLPKWELAGCETETMIGFNAAPAIADAWVKGLIPLSRLPEYYEALRGTAERPDNSHDYFRNDCYIPADEDNESVSKTLEFSYDNWCVSVVAKALGLQDDYAEYAKRSQYWKNVFDPVTRYMRPRDRQEWTPDFSPLTVSSHFTEANSWQYSFFVPQDIAGHITMCGGREAYVAKLDSLFAADPAGDGTQLQDVTGLVGQYAHGNEPSHHVAYLYDFVGQPWKTQEIVRNICRTFYYAAPDGLCGNEDCGQMSAWYVMSALGMYSVTPGTTVMALTSPLVDKAVIDTGESLFTITSDNAGKTYVASAKLNGRPYDYAALDFNEILRGGRLSFKTGDKASDWGREPVMVTCADPAHPYDAWFPADFGKVKRNTAPLKYVAHPNTPYNAGYTAGGDNALVDGKRGKMNWRVNLWQGYRGNDVDVTIDLKGEKDVFCVSAGFIQDMGSYIWMPKDMEVYLSQDGENFTLAGRRVCDVAIDDPKVQIQDWTVSFDSTKASYVRIVAHLFGEIPSWHRGYGDKSFIFIDEVWVNGEENGTAK